MKSKISLKDRKKSLFLPEKILIAIRKEQKQLQKKGYILKETDIIYKRLRDSYGLTDDE